MLKAEDAASNIFVYTGSLRWSVENGALTPESMAITGGRAVYSNNSWATNYYITDHLGSVRAVTDAEGERSKNKGRIEYPYSGTDVVHPKFRVN